MKSSFIKSVILFTALLLIPLSLLTLPSQAQAAPKKIGIIVFDGFLTGDVTGPIEVLGAAKNQPEFKDYKITLISAHKKLKVVSEEGLPLLAEKTIYDGMKYDVLIVPSAYEMKPFLEDKKLIEFIKTHKNASAIASNCSGAHLLAEAGILNGKKATTWAGGEKDLQKNYPQIKVQTNINYVVDGNIITSNGGPVSYQAALKLLEMLSSKSFAEKISSSIQFDRISKTY